MKARLPLSLLIVSLVFGACGGSEDANPSVTGAHRPRPPAPAGLARACGRIPTSRVAALVRGAGGETPRLSRSSRSSPSLTQCRFRSNAVNAELTLDSEAHAVTGYFNRLTELAQFSSRDPSLRPVPVRGLGDRNVPGGGANWVPAFDQLFSVRDGRMLIASFYVKGVADRTLRLGAKRLSRIAYTVLESRHGI